MKNIDRSAGTILGAEITRFHKEGLPEDTIVVNCKGVGGQSFGAFIPKGLTMTLCGDTNDYYGKGLSGGKLVVYPPKNRGYKAEENIIVGNVALYGATAGKVFINGVAGERFAVRNSGAYAVVEGVGEHGCEYMTGGRVAVLGKTGKNFAAGMSGGIAYVLDENSHLYRNLNKAMIAIEKVENKYDIQELRAMIEEHVENTGSARGKEILADFDAYLQKFKKIIPHDYKKMIALASKWEERGMSSEQAQMEAFNESFQMKEVRYRNNGKTNRIFRLRKKNTKAETPLQRIRHFHEFKTSLPVKDNRNRATLHGLRLPFCQNGSLLAGMTSGCPLHNLVPETNDLIYRGNWKQAYERLEKTHCFPEFTGRVCRRSVSAIRTVP